MRTHPVTLDTPEGYLLCPYPKQWIREHEKIYLRMEPGIDRPDINVEVVLPILSTHRALIDWMTTYSSVKGSREFLVALQDDMFYVEPNHNKVKYETVTVQACQVRLYAKANFKQSSSR